MSQRVANARPGSKRGLFTGLVGVPLTLVLSFPVGLGLGQTIRDAHATTCQPETEAWSLELEQIEEEGTAETSLRDFEWPAQATVAVNGLHSNAAWFHDGPDQTLRLYSAESP